MQVDVIYRLNQSIKQLEMTVTAAKERIELSYGKKHPLVERLNSYGPTIKGQKDLVVKLQKAIGDDDVEEIGRLINIINSISLMIKDDARDLLLELQGISCIPDEDMLQ